LETLRLFCAVEIDETVRRRLLEFQDELRGAAGIKWVAPENLHITIKFLGDVEASRVPRVAAALAEAASSVPPFEISIRGAGAFPGLSRPRVVWVGTAVRALERGAGLPRCRGLRQGAPRALLAPRHAGTGETAAARAGAEGPAGGDGGQSVGVAPGERRLARQEHADAYRPRLRDAGARAAGSRRGNGRRRRAGRRCPPTPLSRPAHKDLRRGITA